MPVIKRYPNRKLYDTNAKQYITLEGIADLIRLGQDIQVIDNASGEDLTTVTLTQIIFELEKKQSGFLPRSILASLIETGGDRLHSLQKNIFGQLTFFTQVDEEIKQRIQALVKQGELADREGKRLIDRMISLGAGRLSQKPLPVDQDIERVLEKRRVPTRQDMDHLMDQLDTLMHKLDELENLRDHDPTPGDE